MVSAKNRADGSVELRLQRIFLDASDIVLDEIAELLSGGKNDKVALKQFIDACFNHSPDASRPSSDPGPDAAAQNFASHDIQSYATRLNSLYLQGRSTAQVRWGRRSTRRSTRSIRFACYDPSRNVIIMNRKMDNSQIPEYFVEYVLFHEMLHEVLGIGSRPDGKRDIHGRLFKLMESTYPDFEKARRFERHLCNHLGSLL